MKKSNKSNKASPELIDAIQSRAIVLQEEHKTRDSAKQKLVRVMLMVSTLRAQAEHACVTPDLEHIQIVRLGLANLEAALVKAVLS